MGLGLGVINRLLKFASHGLRQRFHGSTRVSCFAGGDELQIVREYDDDIYLAWTKRRSGTVKF